MKKIIFGTSFVLILLIFFQISTKPGVYADWWQRPEVRPTQPSEPRNLPTSAPTSPPSQPTLAPTSPPTGGTPSEGGGGGGTKEDPCAPGKSYVGPYCGWSPDTTKSGGGGGGGGGGEARVGGPQVLGLSNTSSSDVYLSDIIFLVGILCLTLYAKSKLTTDNRLL